MPNLRSLAIFGLLALTACPPPPGAPDAGGCPPGELPLGATRACQKVGWSECPLGFVADDGGLGCLDALPDSCPPGTAALLGESACAPIGPSSCAAGFVKDPSGWGCADVLPPATCTGPNREALGSPTCLPVGDCAAPFPPANASVVVDPSAPLDATHVHAIADALALAPDGGVIAIAPGTYAEALVLGHSVSLVGRCPASVVLDGAATALPALSALTAQDSRVSGLTIRNAAGAVVAAYGAHVSLEDVVVEGSRGTAVKAFWPKTTLSLTRSVIRGTRFDGASEALEASDHAQVTVRETAFEDTEQVAVRSRGLGTAVALNGTVVRDVWLADGGVAPMGTVVEAGATLTLVESAVIGATQAALFVTGSDSTATVSDSVLRDLRATPTLAGYGAYVQDGTLTLRRTTVLRAVGIGVVAKTADAHLVGEDVVVGGTRPTNGSDVAVGLDVEGGSARFTGLAVLDSVLIGVRATGAASSLELTRALVRGVSGVSSDASSAGHGLEIFSGARGTFTQVSITECSQGGVSVQGEGSTAALDRVHVSDVEAAGVFVRELASATVRRSAVVRARDTGMFVYDRASLTLADTVVRDTRTALGPGGNPGLGLAGVGTGALVVQRCALVNNLAFGVLLEGAQARIEDTRIAGTDGLPDWGAGVQLQGQTTLTMDGVVLEENGRLGLSCAEASTATIGRSWLGRARAVDGQYGHGLLVFGDSRAVARDVSVRGNETIGVVASGAGVVLDGCDVSENLVALHAQAGTTVVEQTQPPAEPLANTLTVSHDSTFLDNESRLGSGQVPLPATMPLAR